MIYKNVANQIAVIYAFNSSGNLPATGISNTITATLFHGTGLYGATSNSNPRELSGGAYAFTITQNESNTDALTLVPATTSPNVIIPTQTFYTSSILPDVNIAQINSSTIAAQNLGNDYNGVGYARTNSSMGSITTPVSVSGIPTVNVIQISGSAPAANTLAAILGGSVRVNRLNLGVGTVATGSFVSAIGDKTGYTLSSAGLSGIFASTGNMKIPNISFAGVLDTIIAFIAGKVTGATTGAGTIAFRNYFDTYDAIRLTVDANGNRSVTLIATTGL